MGDMEDVLDLSDESEGGDGTGGDEADEDSPAEDFGFRIGWILGLALLALAFFGPSHLLVTSRYELPVVASIREPLPMDFLLVTGAVTFVFGLVAALSFPRFETDYQDDYETELGMGLMIPTVIIIVGMLVLGLVFPALYYAVTGELVRAGLVLGMAVVLVVAGFLFEIIAILAIAIGSAPLWVPTFAGVYTGSYLRKGAAVLGG